MFREELANTRTPPAQDVDLSDPAAVAREEGMTERQWMAEQEKALKAAEDAKKKEARKKASEIRKAAEEKTRKAAEEKARKENRGYTSNPDLREVKDALDVSINLPAQKEALKEKEEAKENAQKGQDLASTNANRYEQGRKKKIQKQHSWHPGSDPTYETIPGDVTIPHPLPRHNHQNEETAAHILTDHERAHQHQGRPGGHPPQNYPQPPQDQDHHRGTSTNANRYEQGREKQIQKQHSWHPGSDPTYETIPGDVTIPHPLPRHNHETAAHILTDHERAHQQQGRPGGHPPQNYPQPPQDQDHHRGTSQTHDPRYPPHHGNTRPEGVRQPQRDMRRVNSHNQMTPQNTGAPDYANWEVMDQCLRSQRNDQSNQPPQGNQQQDNPVNPQQPGAHYHNMGETYQYQETRSGQEFVHNPNEIHPPPNNQAHGRQPHHDTPGGGAHQPNTPPQGSSNPSNLGVGSNVQVASVNPNDPQHYGVIRWTGRVAGVDGQVAGIELVSIIILLNNSMISFDHRRTTWRGVLMEPSKLQERSTSLVPLAMGCISHWLPSVLMKGLDYQLDMLPHHWGIVSIHYAHCSDSTSCTVHSPLPILKVMIIL